MTLTSEQLKDQLAAAVASSSEDLLAESVKQAVEAIAEQPDFQAIASMAISFPAVKSKGQLFRRIAGAVKRRINLDKDARDLVRMLERSLEAGGPVELDVSTGDELTNEPPPREWIVDGWIPANRVTMFTGQGEVGKSRLALQLAAGVASEHRVWIPGNEQFDAKMFTEEGYAKGLALTGDEPQTAVVASWEDEHDEIKRRLQAQSFRPAPKYDLIHVLNMIGKGPLWQPGGDEEGLHHTSVMGAATALAGKLREYCEEVGARLLIVDTLAAAFACNENDRGLVRQFMSDLDNWALKAQCAVVILAHPPKSSGRGEDTPTYSGSTDWHGASRAMISLSKTETNESKNERARVDAENRSRSRKPKIAKPESESALRLSLDKSNYGWAGQTLWLAHSDGMLVSKTQRAAAESAKAVGQFAWVRKGATNGGNPQKDVGKEGGAKKRAWPKEALMDEEK